MEDKDSSSVSVPSWSVVGSISPTFTNNALFSRDDRRSDFYYEPDVSVRLDGYLTNDLSYRLYAARSMMPSRRRRMVMPRSRAWGGA